MPMTSCVWVTKPVQGELPPARQGHAIACQGDSVYLFGGSAQTKLNTGTEAMIYYNDFYRTVVFKDGLRWESIDHTGQIPSGRDSHAICIEGDKVYVYGGKSTWNAPECLEILYCFSIGNRKWSIVPTHGKAPRSLGHSLSQHGKTLYVFGGIVNGEAVNDLYMLHLEALIWTTLKTYGMPPAPRCDHAAAVVDKRIYIFGGSGGPDVLYNDLHVFDIGDMSWRQPDVEGDKPAPRGSHSFTAHRNKDIYVFGGYNDSNSEGFTAMQDLHKLSLAKLKWKKPVYSGLLAERRYGHVAFVMQKHLYIFGGINDSGPLGDLKVAKLVNPSDRTPVLQNVMLDQGVQGPSTAFQSTKKPHLNYELEHPPFSTVDSSSAPAAAAAAAAATASVQQVRDLTELRQVATSSSSKDVEVLEQHYHLLDREKSELEQARSVLEREREAYEYLYHKQQQELERKLDQHKTATESWLEARVAENDQDRKLISQQKAEMAERKSELLKREKETAEKSAELHSITQQFAGM